AETGRVLEDAQQRVSWSLLFACGDNSLALQLAYWTSVLGVACFALGLAPRFTALFTWLVVVSFSANPVLEYDGDVFLLVPAFYLMLGFVIGSAKQLGQSWGAWLFSSAWPANLLWRSKERAPVAPSLGANLALRLFQV